MAMHCGEGMSGDHGRLRDCSSSRWIVHCCAMACRSGRRIRDNGWSLLCGHLDGSALVMKELDGDVSSRVV